MWAELCMAELKIEFYRRITEQCWQMISKFRIDFGVRDETRSPKENLVGYKFDLMATFAFVVSSFRVDEDGEWCGLR